MKAEFNKVKIIVFIPEEKVSELRDAVCNAGAGVIGNYSYCTSSTKVSGTYIPSENAKPYIGTQNTLEFVEEIKIEFICDVKKVKNVLRIIREIHPYEEPGIDIIPLLDEKLFK